MTAFHSHDLTLTIYHLITLIPRSTFYVWTVAARNNHYLVTLASLLVIITFSFQPLSAALFNVQDVFWLEPRAFTACFQLICDLTVMCDWGVRLYVDKPSFHWSEPGRKLSRFILCDLV